MTAKMTKTKVPVESPVEQKQIILSCNGHLKWGAEFHGNITHRDLRRLQRVLVVEFAKQKSRRRIESLQRSRQSVTPQTEKSITATTDQETNENVQNSD